MALLLRRTTLRALLRRGSTWSRSTDPVPPAFLTSLDNPQTYFDSSELRAVGGLETQPQALSAETENKYIRELVGTKLAQMGMQRDAAAQHSGS